MSAAAEPIGEERVVDGLSVRCFGPEDGAPLLFSPGLGGNGDYWLPQVRSFADYHRVILYDHRGTARSERADLRAGYDAGDLADDIAKVLDGLGLKAAHVVGHAAGAVAGLALADTAPDRLLSLTLVNGWAQADRHFARCMAIRRDIYDAGGALAYLNAQPLFLYPAEWISEHLDELDAEAAHVAPRFQSRQVLFARMAALEGFRLEDHGADFDRPVLIVVSGDDMLVPPHCSIELADRLRSARLATMHWGGHAVNITNQESFDALLRDFLATSN